MFSAVPARVCGWGGAIAADWQQWHCSRQFPLCMSLWTAVLAWPKRPAQWKALQPKLCYSLCWRAAAGPQHSEERWTGLLQAILARLSCCLHLANSISTTTRTSLSDTEDTLSQTLKMDGTVSGECTFWSTAHFQAVWRTVQSGEQHRQGTVRWRMPSCTCSATSHIVPLSVPHSPPYPYIGAHSPWHRHLTSQCL